MMVPSTDVVHCARSYLGVRYAHQGRTSMGLDCAGLIVRVAHDLGLSAFDTQAYGRVPRADTLRELVSAHCARTSEMLPGTIALMKFVAEPQHLAIIGGHEHGVSLIHALAQHRKVVEHRLDEVWASRVVELYCYPGVVY